MSTQCSRRNVIVCLRVSWLRGFVYIFVSEIPSAIVIVACDIRCTIIIMPPCLLSRPAFCSLSTRTLHIHNSQNISFWFISKPDGFQLCIYLYRRFKQRKQKLTTWVKTTATTTRMTETSTQRRQKKRETGFLASKSPPSCEREKKELSRSR